MLMHRKTCLISIVVFRFYNMTLFHSQTRRHMIRVEYSMDIIQQSACLIIIQSWVKAMAYSLINVARRSAVRFRLNNTTDFKLQ